MTSIQALHAAIVEQYQVHWRNKPNTRHNPLVRAHFKNDMKTDKAKMLDDILKRFSGNITITWDSLREEFKDDMDKYYILENNINFLVGDGILKRDTTLHTLCMTDKGFATMTDPENLGYVPKAKKETRDNRIKNIAFVITIATFLVLCYNFCKTNFNSKNESVTPKTFQENIQGLKLTQNKSLDSIGYIKNDTVRQTQPTKIKTTP